MENRIAIKADHISKVYRLYDKPIDRLKESLNPFRRSYHHDYYALKDVSFEVRQGETVGIVGTNGAGKSTLLKVLTGVTVPSGGNVTVNGKISALLELGAGFNPEYTGMQNIYLNGTLLGYSKAEMDERVENILSFADIGDYINQPVKNYSSGMFARLAFAVAINVEPEILIVDEALSVGDVFFQLKCFKKFQDFKKMGKTVLLVTHNMNNVISYCDRAILLDRGKKVKEGSSKEIVDLYKKSQAGLLDMMDDSFDILDENEGSYQSDDLWKSHFEINPNYLEYGNKTATIIDFGVLNDENEFSTQLEKDGKCSFIMRVRFHKSVQEPIFAYAIKDINGLEITGSNTMLEKTDIKPVRANQAVEIKFTQRLPLQGGPYFLSFGCTRFNSQGEVEVFHRLYDILCLTINAGKVSTGFFDLGSQVRVQILDS